jgi:phosphoenolpyruvate carboxylase
VAAAEGAEALDALALTARAAYRALVWDDPAFEAYFGAATPIAELSMLSIGSRPAARAGATTLESLRAIPWVFAWSQSRANLPGWYGTGTALADFRRARGPPVYVGCARSIGRGRSFGASSTTPSCRLPRPTCP